ncbi:hypothetical protein [Microtetraspora malaysiensis]|uniref:hypothetical protein n=1 Tax=Microtetraspora malaysiensis TaxID=161358 RepID=UPI003D8F465E
MDQSSLKALAASAISATITAIYEITLLGIPIWISVSIVSVFADWPEWPFWISSVFALASIPLHIILFIKSSIEEAKTSKKMVNDIRSEIRNLSDRPLDKVGPHPTSSDPVTRRAEHTSPSGRNIEDLKSILGDGKEIERNLRRLDDSIAKMSKQARADGWKFLLLGAISGALLGEIVQRIANTILD